MRAIILHEEQPLLGFRLGELLLKEPIQIGRWLSYVESKSGAPQAYLVVDEGGARWALEALASMQTSHRGALEMLVHALKDELEHWGET